MEERARGEPDFPFYEGRWISTICFLDYTYPIMTKERVWVEWHVEIDPASSRWLPWPGRTSRWWFEIGSKKEGDVFPVSWAYSGGSGGGFTLRSCLRKAAEALERCQDQYEAEANTRYEEEESRKRAEEEVWKGTKPVGEECGVKEKKEDSDGNSDDLR